MNGADERGAQVVGAADSAAVASSEGKDNERGLTIKDTTGSDEGPRSGDEGGGGDEPLAVPRAPKAQRPRKAGERSSKPVDHWLRRQVANAAKVAPDPAVKCIAPPQVDGGTRFGIKAPSSTWSAELRELVTFMANGRKLARDLDLIDQHGVVIRADVGRTKDGNGIKIIVDGAQLNLYPAIGKAFLETKARSVWAIGLECWMNTWFPSATFWLTGNSSVSTARDAGGAGWYVDKLELCGDFTGLHISSAEADYFTHARGGPERTQSHGRRTGAAETISIGKRRAHATSVQTHCKTLAIEDRLHISPTTSVYAPGWRLYGWNGRDEVRRVEVRAHGRSLRLRARDGGRPDLDLTDPANLLDPQKRAAFWRFATHQRTRLVQALPDTPSKRLRRLRTDPRWVAVQNAGGLGEPVRYTRDSVQEARLLLKEQAEVEATDKAARALGRLAALKGIDPDDISNLLPALVEAPGFRAGLRR
ncbi:MAG: hypothetical protein U0174_03495 [Polyangiaceae bacterium]